VPEQTPEPTDEQPSDQAEPATTEREEKPASDTPADGEEDELPEWARKELTKVRTEAASYRTRLREAESKLGEAKSPEEFEAALTELKTKNAELERSLLIGAVVRKYELPEALAARLRGDTTEELEADAKALHALLAPAAPESLGGGLTPADEDDGELDPRKLARLTRR
jgi:hypothetical protein